jgi:serine/threonine protein kinase
MLSLFTRLKKGIHHILINNGIINKRPTYNILQQSQQMFVNCSGSGSDFESESEFETDPESKPKPEPEPENIIIEGRKLFNTVIPNNILENDNELQELIQIITGSNINVDNVILHKRFEAKLIESPTNCEDIIFKTKMRLLYVIISNNLYRTAFEEKKLYKSNKTKYLIGVFRYNDYIIRIDDSPYCFLDEQQIMTIIKDNNVNDNDKYENIVIPYFTYINMKQNAKGDMCDCDCDPCGCSYVGDGSVYCADDDNDGDDCDGDGAGDGKGAGDYSRAFYNRLRYNTISFSIQPYIKHTESLHTWSISNITDNVNINFDKLKFTFFTNLFYKCALLIQKIHSIDLVHGDIKPDNILMKEDGSFNINDPVKCRNFSVYLIDFGLSGKNNIGIGTGGTVPYCHPEFRNIRDTKRTDKYNWNVIRKKHDVWSLGLAFITLYIHNTFYSYYYKYPSYFFNASGYVSALILDSIANQQLSSLFHSMLSYDSISINDVCERIRVML